MIRLKKWVWNHSPLLTCLKSHCLKWPTFGIFFLLILIHVNLGKWARQEACFNCRHLFKLGKGSGKKNRISYGLLPNRGGVGEGSKKTILLFWKSIFSESMQNHSRTPKTCFTLGLESFGHIYSYLNSFESGTLWLPWWSPAPLNSQLM